MADVLPSAEVYDGGYPDDQMAPEDKGFKWHLLCAKALYAKQKSLLYLSNARRLDYIENRMYADGNQNTTKYVDKLATLKQQGKTVSYRDLNWGIISTAPKLINAILGYWEKLDYDIFFDCINPMAAEDRKFVEAAMKTKIILKEFNDYIAQQTGVQGPVPDGMEPQNLQELQELLKDGFRLPYEMEMELGVQMVQEENGWKKEIRRQIRREFIINGVGFCKIWVDRISQRVKMRNCDVVNCVIEDFYGNDGDASRGIGEVITYTIAEARLEWGDQFTEYEYWQMAKASVGQYGNPLQLAMYADYVNTDAQYNLYKPYDNFKITVLDWEVFSSDRIKKEITDKRGYTETFHVDSKTKTYRKQKNKDGNIYTTEVKAIDIKTVRGGKWIINTEFMADWGKKHDIARPNENRRECYREFKFYRVANKSVLESVLPILDMLQTAVLQKQNFLNRAMPPGFTLEMGAFDKVLLDGKIKSSEELFTIASETGNIIYRQQSTIDDEGRINQTKPVEWVERTIAPVMVWWEEIKNNIELIRTISGINEMMDATTPGADQPVGTSELALQGAENCLSPMIQGMIDMHEKMAYTIMLKLQVIARNNKIDGYISLGSGFKMLISVGKDISPLWYATRVQALPTAQQKQVILQMAQEAVTSNLETGSGGMDPADYVELTQFLAIGGNLKLAAIMLRKAMDKAQAKKNADADARTKAQTQSAIEAAQAAEKEKRDTAELLHKHKMEQINLEGAWKIKQIEAQGKEGREDILVDKETDKRVNAHKKSLESQIIA